MPTAAGAQMILRYQQGIGHAIAHTVSGGNGSTWDRVFSKFFGFPLSVSFHQHSILTYHLEPVNGCSSETQTHPINMNKTGHKQAKIKYGPARFYCTL
jgi:hypothetical protein